MTPTRPTAVAYAECLPTLGGAEKYGLAALCPLAGPFDVTVLYRAGKAFDPAGIAERFGFAPAGVRYEPVRSAREVVRRAKRADLFVNMSYASVLPNPARTGLLFVYFPVPLADHPQPAGVGQRAGQAVERFRQRVLDRVEDAAPDLGTMSFGQYRRARGLGRAVAHLPYFLTRKLAWVGYRDLRLGAREVASYTRLITISEFTAEWTRRNYGRASDILHPPVHTRAFAPAEKVREIVAVGRFDDGENSKRFDVLVDAFRRGHDAGPLRGWTLRVCGATAGAESFRYLARLRDIAAGRPVTFETDLPLARLAERYARATLYWHAMGYGADPVRTPWKYEHFGMSVVEAMAAGCVPMVFGAAGPAEIVGGAGCGYLWSSPEGLLEAVREFQSLSPLGVERLAIASRRRAEEFGLRAFFTRATELYRDLALPHRRVDELLPHEPHQVTA
jgi:glycosyltransferase involved in cell wall biosynthesis